MRVIHRTLIIVAALLVSGLVGFWRIGTHMIAATPRSVAAPASPLALENVRFASPSGSNIAAWFVDVAEPRAVVLLMHPVRGDRASVLARAEFLVAAGYSVLMFDFQAHGESPGDAITFGKLESLDAAAAVDYVKKRFGDARVVAIGMSLGGAAGLLADPPLAIDALVLESVYPTIETAVANRLRLRFGRVGAALTPLFLKQMEFRLGLTADSLRPIVRAGDIEVPVLVMSGSEDRRTTAHETLYLYDAFTSQKSVWLVGGAKHQDLHRYAPEQYERRVLAFLASSTQ